MMTNKVSFLEQKSLIDLVKIQFIPNSSTTDSLLITLLMEKLKTIGLVKSIRKPNLRYFKKGFKLLAHDETQDIVGAIKWQGQSGNVQLELTGKGCNYINAQTRRFEFLYELAKNYNGLLMEIDISVDDFIGKYNFREVNRDYTTDKFSGRSGKRPIREMFNKAGARSIRIGTRGSCKQFQIYDKAKQLKLDTDTTWIRYEVSLYRRTGHTLELDTLIKPDAYFVGAYPKALRKLIKGVKPRSIKREMTQLYASNYVKSLSALKNQWGKCINDLNNRAGSSSKTLALLSRPGEFSKAKLPSYINPETFNSTLLNMIVKKEC